MKHTLLLLLCCTIFACSRPNNSFDQEASVPDQVTLIFENPDSNATYYIPGTDSQSVSNVKARQGYPIEAVDDQNILRYYGFDDSKELDTLVIPTKRNVIELKVIFKAIDRLTYFFHKGDTVFFDYKGNKPYVSILNRNEDFTVTNFALYQRDSLYKVDFLAADKFSNYSFTLNAWSQEMAKTGQNIDLESFQEQFKSSQLQELENQYGIQKQFLDSLEFSGVISSNHKNALLTDTYWTLKVANKQASTPERNSAVDRVLKDIEMQLPSLKTKNDSLLQSLSYQKYFRTLPRITYKPGMIKKQGKGSGSSTANYISLYDSVRNSDIFTPSEKLILQYTYVDQILSNPSTFEIENRLKYLIRFKNDFNDSTLFNRLVDKYDIKFEIDDAIRLVDPKGNETDLKSIIAEQNGKVVYVDFWASWCAPCIKEMPGSKALQAELANEDITFIYLSTDRNSKPWANAIDKHKLNSGLHYRILNADNSKAMEELSVQFIPRYMIYNKEGILINKDAPRPSEKEILINEFTKYLGGE